MNKLEFKYILKYIDMNSSLYTEKEVLEMKACLLKQQGIGEDFDKIMLKINRNILEKVYPYLKYPKPKNVNNKFLDSKVKKILEDFDQAINPLFDNSITLDELDNFLGKINIKARISQTSKDNFRIIFSLASKSVSISKKDDCLIYEFSYKFAPDHYLTISHHVSPRMEMLYIDDYESQNISINYNVTCAEFEGKNREKISCTTEQEDWICNELNKAISLASVIPIDNIRNSSITRTYNK